MKLTPSVTDKIDFSQFCHINNTDEKVTFVIPYNYFHVWRMQGQQEILSEIKSIIKKENDIHGIKDIKDVGKLLKYIEEKIE